MAKPNHHSIAYKMRANPNKTYKELKQKQKARISEWMFRAVCEYYREHGEMPGEDASSEIVAAVYEKTINEQNCRIAQNQAMEVSKFSSGS